MPENVGYEHVKKRILDWDIPTYCKTTKEGKCFFAGLATGTDMTMAEYEDLMKLLKVRRLDG